MKAVLVLLLAVILGIASAAKEKSQWLGRGLRHYGRLGRPYGYGYVPYGYSYGYANPYGYSTGYNTGYTYNTGYNYGNWW